MCRRGRRIVRSARRPRLYRAPDSRPGDRSGLRRLQPVCRDRRRVRIGPLPRRMRRQGEGGREHSGRRQPRSEGDCPRGAAGDLPEREPRPTDVRIAGRARAPFGRPLAARQGSRAGLRAPPWQRLRREPDGSHERKLADCVAGSWSPDGTKIVYSAGVPHNACDGPVRGRVAIPAGIGRIAIGGYANLVAVGEGLCGCRSQRGLRRPSA